MTLASFSRFISGVARKSRHLYLRRAIPPTGESFETDETEVSFQASYAYEGCRHFATRAVITQPGRSVILTIGTWPRIFVSTLLTAVLAFTGSTARGEQTQPMSFRQLTVADGLSQNTVMDILQDDFGYIWLATENGLDRYDGYSVHSYQRGVVKEGDLANDYIWKIDQDEAQNLWLATEGGGVAMWDRQTDRFTHFRRNPGDSNSLSSDRTRTLLHTERGVWVGTHNAGLNLLDPLTGQVMQFRHDPDDSASLPGDSVYALIEDSYGGLWIGTNAGLAWLQSGSRSFVHFQHDPDNEFSLSSNEVRALHLDSHGGVWVGTLDGGLNVLDRRSGRFTHYSHSPTDPTSLSHNDVRGILEDQAGRMWIATINGLNVLQPYASEFQHYFAEDDRDGLSDSYLMSVFQDRGGVLWIGTRTGGVNSWNSRSWTFGHNKPDWLRSLSVTAFATDPNNLWLGTLGGGLKQIDRKTGQVTHISTASPEFDLRDDRVMSLLIDHLGGLWVGTMDHGVAWLPRDRKQFVHLTADDELASSLAHDSAMAIFEDASGKIWIGSFGAGVSLFDPENHSHTHFTHDPQDRSSFCGTQGRDFALDRYGALWIATEQGLCRFDSTTETFTRYQHDDSDPQSIAENSIFSLHQDGGGRLWVGTGGGGLNEVIQQTDGSISFRTITRREGLASNMIYGVRSDGGGQLWLSSNNGLTRYDPITGKATNYRRTHGLQGEEYHYGATHQSADGYLYFGGANGFNQFDPSEVDSTHIPPPVVLTDVLKMNTSIRRNAPLGTTDSIELSYRESAITFQFSALDFTEPENNQYRYQLEGFDEDWVDAGNRSSVTYTNLDGGQYRFRVIAASSEGSWNQEGISIGLDVAPAPWLSAGAFGAYTMVAIGLLLTLMTQQRRRLRRQLAYRDRLEREVESRTEELAHANVELQQASAAKGEFLARMSHEIRSPIHGVLGMTELLTRTTLNSKQAKFAETIGSSARSLLDIINDVLDFSKLETENMELDEIATDIEVVVDDIISMFAVQAHSKNLELVSRLPADGMDQVIVDPLRLRQVLVNLVNNAIKFTERGRIELIVEKFADSPSSSILAFRVKDTGQGIAPENQAHIFDSFAQESAATARQFGGTGLGLSICRELVQLMRGRLNLASAPGEGSTFSFQLNLQKAPLSPPNEPAEISAQVLIAVNEPALARQINHYLDAWGSRCKSTGDTTETLKILIDAVADREHFEVILVSEKLLQSGGDELKNAFEDLRSRSPKVIVLQSITSTETPFLPISCESLNIPLKRKELLQQLSEFSSHAIEKTSVADPKAAIEPIRTASYARVLVVEDSEVNQEVLAGMLLELGCSYALASDGRSAISCAEAEKFDAVLMDYQLPDIDGIETSRRIRSTCPENSETPIIMLTANASVEDRENFLSAGLDDFLAKPCTLEELGEKLAIWLPDANDASPDTIPESHESVVSTALLKQIQLEYDDGALQRIAGLKRPDGSNMLTHAVEVFRSSCDESIQSIRSATELGDIDTIRFLAHKLKSSCANLGAVSMANLCRDLEQTVADKTLAELKESVAQLEEQKTQVNDWLKERTRDSA